MITLVVAVNLNSKVIAQYVVAQYAIVEYVIAQSIIAEYLHPFGT